MSEQIFGDVLNKAKSFLEERGIEIISEETMMRALPLIIECVEAVKEETMTGEQKCDLALRVLLFIVNQSKIDDAKKDLMRELIEGGTLKTTISIIVDASKGNLVLNRREKLKLLKIAKKWMVLIMKNTGCCSDIISDEVDSDPTELADAAEVADAAELAEVADSDSDAAEVADSDSDAAEVAELTKINKVVNL
jgi:hypothetical protein